MRKFVLKNGDFSSPVKEAMNPHPTILKMKDKDSFDEIIKQSQFIVYPIVDENGVVVSAIFGMRSKKH